MGISDAVHFGCGGAWVVFQSTLHSLLLRIKILDKDDDTTTKCIRFFPQARSDKKQSKWFGGHKDIDSTEPISLNIH